jgi:hypothetical protein
MSIYKKIDFDTWGETYPRTKKEAEAFASLFTDNAERIRALAGQEHVFKQGGTAAFPPNTTQKRTESDPTGLDPHSPGAKLDEGKNRLGLVLGGFAKALEEVGKVGTYGAEKYSPDGWKSVPNGVERYEDAMLRHWVEQHLGERVDPATGLRHQAQLVWNALAVLELMLEEFDG